MPISASAAALAAMIVLAPSLAGAQTPVAPRPTHPAHPHGQAGASGAAGALMPGFETNPDGSTRLFLELSKTVAYTTQAVPNKITYVLKDVHVLRRNNRNPLVTVHFNTPLTSARLIQHGHDLWFVLDLRAAVQPQVTIEATKDGTAMMRIELPKGQYVTPSAAPPTSTTSAPEPSSPNP